MLYLILAHYCACYLVVYFMKYALLIVTKQNPVGWVTAQAAIMATVTTSLHYSLFKLGYVQLMIN